MKLQLLCTYLVNLADYLTTAVLHCLPELIVTSVDCVVARYPTPLHPNAKFLRFFLASWTAICRHGRLSRGVVLSKAPVDEPRLSLATAARELPARRIPFRYAHTSPDPILHCRQKR